MKTRLDQQAFNGSDGQNESSAIEDPVIAERLARMKQRWPVIGELADHPLTEYLCQARIPPLPMTARLKMAFFCVFIIAFLGSQFLKNLPWLVGLAALLGGIVCMLLNGKMRRRQLSAELPALMKAKNLGMLTQLKLAPLDMRRLYAIELGRIYCSSGEELRQIGLLLFWLLVPPAVVMAVVMALGLNDVIEFFNQPSRLVLVVIYALILWLFSFGSYYHRDLELISALRVMRGPIHIGRKEIRDFLIIFLFILMIQFVIPLAYQSLPPMLLDFLIFAALLVALTKYNYNLPQKTEKVFELESRRGQALLDRLVGYED